MVIGALSPVSHIRLSEGFEKQDNKQDSIVPLTMERDDRHDSNVPLQKIEITDATVSYRLQ